MAKQEKLDRQAGAGEDKIQHCLALANENKLAFLSWRNLTVVRAQAFKASNE